MADQMCTCGHARRVHSKNGCEDFDLRTNTPCKCKKTYMDNSPGRR